MGIIQLFIILVVISIGLYLINRYLPVDAKIKAGVIIVIIIIVVIWLLRVLFASTGFHDVKI